MGSMVVGSQNCGVHSYAVQSIIKKFDHMLLGALEYLFLIEALKAVYDTT